MTVSRALAVTFVLAAGIDFTAAQSLPPGPPVTITMVTQLSPTIPQYTGSTSRCCARACRRRAAGASR